jgi:hypothetical protein
MYKFCVKVADLKNMSTQHDTKARLLGDSWASMPELTVHKAPRPKKQKRYTSGVDKCVVRLNTNIPASKQKRVKYAYLYAPTE